MACMLSPDGYWSFACGGRRARLGYFIKDFVLCHAHPFLSILVSDLAYLRTNKQRFVYLVELILVTFKPTKMRNHLASATTEQISVHRSTPYIYLVTYSHLLNY